MQHANHGMVIPEILLYDSSYCDNFPKSENIHSLTKIVEAIFPLTSKKTPSSVDKAHFEMYYNIT